MTRTNEELKKVCEHVSYEIWMLNKTASLSDTTDAAKNNAYIESFGLHARVLLDFVYNTNGRSDDVLAVDFFDDPTEWIDSIEEKSEILEKVHPRVGKELAHLTYMRLEVTPEEKEWDRSEICKDINETVKKFLDLVSEEKITDDLKKFGEAI